MDKTLYLAGWVIDGTGAPARRDVLVRVENGLITCLESVRATQLKASGTSCVDYSECTIVPGFVDCHVHLTLSGKTDLDIREKQLGHTFEQNSPLIAERIRNSLSCGIVALRDGGDSGSHTLRFAMQEPEAQASRVHIKCAGNGWRAAGRYGKLVAIPPDSGSTLAGSISRCSAGASHLKILNSGLNSLTEFGTQTAPQFSLEELDSAVRVARSRGQKVMVHANGRLPVELALEAGCDSIEHGFFMGNDNLKKMADLQVFWVPTCYTMKALASSRPAGSKEAEVAARNVEHQLAQIALAQDLGVPLALGTDAGSFGVRHGTAFAREVKLIMDAGFSTEEAIRCATMDGARLLGLEHELGRLCPEMPATFVVLEGAPAGIPESMGRLKAMYIKGEKVI
ncbi:MAG: amidohydrolase family protein [Syntrophobacteraceae bacterium]